MLVLCLGRRRTSVKLQYSYKPQLLHQLPAPKQQSLGGKKELSTSGAEEKDAYAEALAKKKAKNPAHMASALFEMQLQASRQKKQEEAETFAQEGADDVAEAANSEATASANEGQVEVEQADAHVALPEGWGAAWDESAQAYYYYNTALNVTQWEYPAAAASAAAPVQEHSGIDPNLPDELRRELEKEAKRSAAKGKQVAMHDLNQLGAKAVTEDQFWHGEKYKDSTSASAAYHVPMQANVPVTHLAKRKHQITDVLASAAANELKYLEAASQGRRSRQQVNGRYGW
mmetsp:Transcript_34499/g.53861  ORF Transcript_34499/g.53861 Transcript_34499/m.53861 type:complete len:287 (+) Transcript_34499:178-1038(+)